MSLCEELLPLVSCRASGPLDREDEELLSAHLETCTACRAVLAREEDLLEELALPPVTSELRAAVDRLPDRTAVEWRRAERRRQRISRLLGISVAAAAALAMVLAPAYLRDRAYARARQAQELAQAATATGAEAPGAASPAPAGAAAGQPQGQPTTPAIQAASWSGPDLDEVWEASAVVGGGSGDEVAMADEGTIFDSSSP
ncbi:zf-HC2 domain-containing protein [Anaeromyxobacter paludicola]|uniref:Zinc-finger domain-containing protein n=1 Tax=Anaeromyxobacter paludicola TaxID=2918171 RepID=A0ABN6NDZ8_9BACT|nr:zf-HC2 domain-containing protein [Anaeromyxobacter paludicola]BDG10228.1 hypothetical protein AMPC_33410 [Anaeromyxobacter paludicola]